MLWRSGWSNGLERGERGGMDRGGSVDTDIKLLYSPVP